MDANDRNRAEYQRRVNRVLDHVRTHLHVHQAAELALERLAEVASFSPFHFHRVFKAMTGETLGEHIQRTRLERAANLLVTRPHADVLEIALDCGFGSASAFARAFKDRFGQSATEYRRTCPSNPGTADRNLGQVDGNPGKARDAGDRQDVGMNHDTKIKVETLPSYRVAYLRSIGAYSPANISDVWQRLMRWAKARDLWTSDRLCLGVVHDNPKVTDPAKCRYDAALVIQEGAVADGDITVTTLEGGKYALAPYVGPAHEVGRVYDQIFGRWLPQSGYQPDNRLMFELYRGEAFNAATQIFTLDVAVPVRPL